VSAATGARVVLRERTGLEAADLGFAMARAWWRPLAATWLAFVLPAGCVIVWLLRDAPAWSIGLLWWLRPAFARIPLHVLSRELFGEHATLAGTARALPRLLRSGLFTSLVTRRLSLTRTFLQPVLQLEGLRGAARSARVAVLARKETGAAAAAATVVAHLNAAFIAGLLLFVQLATPKEIDWSVMSLVAGDASIPGVLPALYLAGISVFEPLLVACGFGLYLNRRVYLEGWEIELAFRRLAARAERSAPARRFASAAATLLVFLLFVPPAHASDCVPDDVETAGACVHEILNGTDFGKDTTVLRWLPKTFERKQDADALDLSWLAPIVRFVAESARVLLYVALAVGTAALLFALRGARLQRDREPAPLPRTFVGLDLDPASLPEDVAGSARRLWRAGDRVGALSLLYRAALVKLGARGALEIPASATESECVRAVRKTQPEPVASAFGALTSSWIRTRYAHEPPTDGEFEGLCARFARLDAPP
jgi:hypothetical protein